MLMKLTAALFALALLSGVIVLTPSSIGAAEWISRGDSYAAAWVKDIEQELNKKDYRAVFANDPRTPQESVLRLLDRAASAYEAKNATLAAELVREAMEVLKAGVRRNYYSDADIQPILNFIEQHTPIKAA
jgi:hypothetical protein